VAWSGLTSAMMMRVGGSRAGAVFRPNLGALTHVAQLPLTASSNQWTAQPNIILAAHLSTGQILAEPFYEKFRPKVKAQKVHHRENPKSIPWHLVDAKGMVVGRLATEIAAILRGKNKPIYTPNVDHGDHVVVINAKDVVFTGKKETQKLYRWHTGYPGGLKSRTASEMLRRNPTEVLRKAVYGMLPKNKMRVNIAKKLKIFADSEIPSPHIIKQFKHSRVTGYALLEDPPLSHIYNSSVASEAGHPDHDDLDLEYWKAQAIDVRSMSWAEDGANFDDDAQ